MKSSHSLGSVSARQNQADPVTGPEINPDRTTCGRKSPHTQRRAISSPLTFISAVCQPAGALHGGAPFRHNGREGRRQSTRGDGAVSEKANVRGARNIKMLKKHFSYEGNGSGGSDVPFICLISRRGCSRCLPVGGYVNNKKKDLNHRITACHAVF